MTTPTQSPVPRSRLKQVPIDVWSIREKLCLASSVQKSGDQNWSSVSRPLKTFSEPNRPADWFSTKNCALQYQDLLEKIESEMPKKKRGERSEELPGDLIVKKLTRERIEELRRIVPLEKDMLKKLRVEFDMVKSGNISKEKIMEVSNRMKEEEKRKEQELVEHKKWLAERDAKIAVMKANRGFFVSPIKARTPSQVTSPSKTISSNIKVEQQQESIDSPLSLSVDIEEATSSSLPVATTIMLEPKQIMLTTPSTSPLLTSLLQSPTPSTPTIISPTVLVIPGQSKDTSVLTRQSPSTSQSYPPFFPTTSTSPQKQLSISSTPVSIPISLSGDKTPTHAGNSSIVPSSSPTLSKLLEMPPSTPGKLPSLPLIESQIAQQIELRKSPTKSVSSPSKADLTRKEDVEKVDTTEKDVPQSLDKVKNQVEKEKSKDKQHDAVKEKDISTDERDKEMVSVTGKEINESILDDKLEVKQEPMDTSSGDASMTTPTMTTRAKRRRPAPLPVSVSSATRRSGRVKALRENANVSQDESSSEPPSLNTSLSQTISHEKRVSIDEIAIATETSMSEESIEAPKPTVSTPSMTLTMESVPNSPASSTMHSEDAESIKENKLWKKAIMLPWRQASTHKFANIFLSAVTDDDASGYSEIVHRPMDLNLIKRRVEGGQIRTTIEFQRDMMLIFMNAMMYNKEDHDVHKFAKEMQKEVLESIEDFIETSQQSSSQANETKLRVRERRSAATTSTPLLAPTSTPNANEDRESSGRRRSRVASNEISLSLPATSTATTGETTSTGITPSIKVATKKKSIGNSSK